MRKATYNEAEKKGINYVSLHFVKTTAVTRTSSATVNIA